MKRLRIIAVVVVVMLLGCLVIHFATPKEPLYQGRKLSGWINAFDEAGWNQKSSRTEAIKQASMHAVKEIGSNAIPTLLKWLQATNSPISDGCNSILRRQSYISFHFRTASDQNDLAMAGFNILGNDAMPAVPALTQLLQCTDKSTRLRALECLFCTDNEKRVLLPVILQSLQSSDPDVKDVVTFYLARFYPEVAEKEGIYKMYPKMKHLSTNDVSTIPPAAK